MAPKLRALADRLDVGGEAERGSRGTPRLGLTQATVPFSVMSNPGKMGESILLS